MHPDPRSLYERLTATSFLEFAFLRWVLTPALRPEVAPLIHAQHPVTVGEHAYRLDYALHGAAQCIAVELDGFAAHGGRDAFTHDRLRQNDLQAAGWTILRFSYDAIRTDTARCVQQLQTLCALDPALATYVVPHPRLEPPAMDPDPALGLGLVPQQHFMPRSDWMPPLLTLPLAPSAEPASGPTYFDGVRERLNIRTLRLCQLQAYEALRRYYRDDGLRAACVMSVGAGKTALGVLGCLAFARQRALIITPGTVIRGTFATALDGQAIGNTLYGLPKGPLIPGCPPPRVLTLDSADGPIRGTTTEELLTADVIVTNFQSLGTGEDPEDLLAKLAPGAVDFVVVDEAHIAAADSYQRTFRHFAGARMLLMSACFQRLDGKPIEADVVYRYRLIDSIADGNAKNLRVHLFAPEAEATIYELIQPDGRHEEIVGREALLAVLGDERKLAHITAKSDAPIRQVMQVVKSCLDRQARLLAPIKPRVLFSALGERHAEQIARVADACGIPCAHLHYVMPDARIRSLRERFEQDSGDLQGLVQLKMLGQGYDLPPITVVVPMRPYGSFSEFYQFIGRGIRALHDPALRGRVGPEHQFLDIVYHAELGLDAHIDAIYRENDMDPPQPPRGIPEVDGAPHSAVEASGTGDMAGSGGASSPTAFVLFEHGTLEERIVHDEQRVEQRRIEREREALAQRYAIYAASTTQPVPFEQFIQIMRLMSERG